MLGRHRRTSTQPAAARDCGCEGLRRTARDRRADSRPGPTSRHARSAAAPAACTQTQRRRHAARASAPGSAAIAGTTTDQCAAARARSRAGPGHRDRSGEWSDREREEDVLPAHHVGQRGTAWIVTTVSRKPVAGLRGERGADVPLVRGLGPTRWRTPRSRRSPRLPRRTGSSPSTSTGVPKNIGASRQHVPLTTMAVTAAGARPIRSDATPPSQQPRTPATPMARKLVRLTTAPGRADLPHAG